MTRRLLLLQAFLAFGPLTLACGEESLGPRVDCNTERTPPSVTWLEPEAGTTVSGTVKLVVNATDNCYTTMVRFTIDGGDTLGTADNFDDQPAPSTFTYSLEWDSRSVTNGPVTVAAHADDARNPVPNTGFQTRQFTVANP
jgi:hypothetical protein